MISNATVPSRVSPCVFIVVFCGAIAGASLSDLRLTHNARHYRDTVGAKRSAEFHRTCSMWLTRRIDSDVGCARIPATSRRHIVVDSHSTAARSRQKRLPIASHGREHAGVLCGLAPAGHLLGRHRAITAHFVLFAEPWALPATIAMKAQGAVLAQRPCKQRRTQAG